MNEEQIKAIVSVTIPTIIASFVIIFFTNGISEPNGLNALIGGYGGLLIGMVLVVMLVIQQLSSEMLPLWTYILRIFPFAFIVVIISIIISLLIVYYDVISKGNVSTYYSSFSLITTIFLATQIYMLISPIVSYKFGKINLSLSQVNKALLNLLGVINLLMVGTMGIVLKFYSTQG